jgi:hypothetical protein
LKLADELERRAIGLRILDELDLVGLRRGGVDGGVQLVVIQVVAVPLDRRRGPDVLLQGAQRGGIAVHEIGVVGDVRHHLDARGREQLVPLGLDGARELHQVEALAARWQRHAPQGLAMCRCGVDRPRVEEETVVVVAELGPLGQGGERPVIHLHELEGAIVREHGRADATPLQLECLLRAELHLMDGGLLLLRELLRGRRLSRASTGQRCNRPCRREQSEARGTSRCPEQPGERCRHTAR